MNDEQAIRDVMDRWMSATKAGESVADLMTDDAVFLTPGRAPFGKDVFRVAAAAMKDMKLDGDQKVEEVCVMGDHAYARTQLTVKATMPDGKTIVRDGYTLTIFRKEDGAWKLARDANLLAVRT